MAELKNKSNKKITHKVINTEKGSYISEIQEFTEPENYENAFERYYPKD